MPKTIWITGVSGFSGGHLLNYIQNRRENTRIVGIDVNANGPQGLDAYYNVDLNKTDDLASAVTEDPPDQVFHLAAVLPPAPEKEMWYVNVGGTLNLIHVLASFCNRNVRLLGIGSAGEYLPSTTGKMKESSPCGGMTVNGRIKWAQTMLTLRLGEELNMDTVVVRPFNLIGPGLSTRFVAGALCAQFADEETEEIQVGNIYSERDFIDIRDAVAAYWAVMQGGNPGRIYNVCSGIPTRIQSLIEIFSRFSKIEHTIEKDENRLRKVDLDRVFGDCQKIQSDVGWQPKISLEASLVDMLEAVKI